MGGAHVENLTIGGDAGRSQPAAGLPGGILAVLRIRRGWRVRDARSGHTGMRRQGGHARRGTEGLPPQAPLDGPKPGAVCTSFANRRASAASLSCSRAGRCSSAPAYSASARSSPLRCPVAERIFVPEAAAAVVPHRRDPPGLRRHDGAGPQGAHHRPRQRDRPAGDRRRGQRAGGRRGRRPARVSRPPRRLRRARSPVPGRAVDAVARARRARSWISRSNSGSRSASKDSLRATPPFWSGKPRRPCRSSRSFAPATQSEATIDTSSAYQVMGYPGTAPNGYARVLRTGASSRPSSRSTATCPRRDGRAFRHLHRRLGLRRLDLRVSAGRALPGGGPDSEHRRARSRPAPSAHRLPPVDGCREPVEDLRADPGAGCPDPRRQRRRRWLELLPRRVAALAERDVRAPRSPARRRPRPAHVAAGDQPHGARPLLHARRAGAARAAPDAGSRSPSRAGCGRRRSIAPATPATACRSRSISIAASSRSGVTPAASTGPRTR